MSLARISLNLSRHFSLSFIVSGRSSGLHPISSHSCCMHVRDGRPAFAWPYAGVHRSTSLMSTSLLLQQCPACLVRLTWIVFVMGGRWPYSWCLVGCCFQDLFNISRNIYIYIYIYIYKFGNSSRKQPEGFLSLATTLKCRGGYYSFPWKKYLCVCMCVFVCLFVLMQHCLFVFFVYRSRLR